MAQIAIQNEEHWHELRAANVGGSEAAALFGQCSYLTQLELWLIKRGEASGEIPDNDRMFWGRMLEGAIAQGVAVSKGWVITNPRAYFTCDDTPGMGCTPDRIVLSQEREGPGLLQIKNVDRLVFMGWEDGQPPFQYQLQLQHELACTGFGWGVLAVLVGGNDLKLFEFDAHTGAITKIKAAIADFWASVRAGNMPKATGDDYDILREFYGKDCGEEIDLSGDNELPMLCATVKDAAKRKTAAEKEEKAAKAAILQKIGSAWKATCAGFEIKQTKVSKEGYFVNPTSYSMLKIKEEKLND